MRGRAELAENEKERRSGNDRRSSDRRGEERRD